MEEGLNPEPDIRRSVRVTWLSPERRSERAPPSMARLRRLLDVTWPQHLRLITLKRANTAFVFVESGYLRRGERASVACAQACFLTRGCHEEIFTWRRCAF